MTILGAIGIDQMEENMLGIIEVALKTPQWLKNFLEDVIGRGLDPSRPRLYVLDVKRPTKALRCLR